MADHGKGSMLTVGSAVYTQDGTHLGKVKEIQGSAFKVDAPMQPDYWLSTQSVSGAMGDGVSVSFSNGELDQHRMERPDGQGEMSGEMERGTVREEKTITREHTHEGAAAMRTDATDMHDKDRNTKDERKIELKEEQLHATKERVQAGEVNIRKEVVSEQQTIDVPVRREEVYIERRPVSGDRPSGGTIGEGETISVPIMEEQVKVEKTAVVREEIEIGKRVTEDTERVTDSVRHEEIRVEGDGDVKTRDADPKMMPRDGEHQRERTL